MKYLYFSAAWCGPCKSLSPIMNEVSSQVAVEKIDVDLDYERAQQYGVRNIPTVILVDGVTEVKRFIGVQPTQTYLNEVKNS
jgi:thioredoxin 1|tara:strand:- start:524 stop:769 length:246 start_codon:yes stop_codon:yes gene_type:complete